MSNCKHFPDADDYCLICEAAEMVYRIEHDGFEGTVIGSYITREGKKGVVLQQVGTRVVHVYSTKWLRKS